MAFPAFLDACVLVPIALTDAVRANAAVIVTANLGDFPASALKRYDITAVHPDEFLLDQLDLHPQATVQCIHGQIAAYNNPKMNIAEFLESFSGTVPKFARAVGPLLLANPVEPHT